MTKSVQLFGNIFNKLLINTINQLIDSSNIYGIQIFTHTLSVKKKIQKSRFCLKIYSFEIVSHNKSCLRKHTIIFKNLKIFFSILKKSNECEKEEDLLKKRFVRKKIY